MHVIEARVFGKVSVSAVIAHLLDYERVPDDVDGKVGQSAYVGITSSGPFSPNTNIDEGYYRRHITVIDERLALAGVRLAAVLNRVLVSRPAAR